jgi:sigma-E factor negative regulatory protein RseB
VRLKGILLAGLCALGPAAVHAQSADALAWLRKIHDATQKLSYSGTFVYQNGSRSETSRITRYADASGDIEKLEVMDGVPREIVRTKDTVRCYLPGSRLVKVDRRTERGFPALLPERITALARHYEIELGGVRRIAGYDSQAIVLKPRDRQPAPARFSSSTTTSIACFSSSRLMPDAAALRARPRIRPAQNRNWRGRA